MAVWREFFPKNSGSLARNKSAVFNIYYLIFILSVLTSPKFDDKIMTMKLLLHTCCAPCSMGCVPALLIEAITPDLFWYNPNIHPYDEYLRRYNSLKRFAEEEDLEMLSENEDLPSSTETLPNGAESGNEANQVIARDSFQDIFVKNTSGLIKEERCRYCYKTRLEKTALTARGKNYDAFSTTLLISPYQNHEEILSIGEEAASIYGVEFLYRDFRPNFREAQRQARASSYYMQKYCGCVFSKEEVGGRS